MNLFDRCCCWILNDAAPVHPVEGAATRVGQQGAMGTVDTADDLFYTAVGDDPVECPAYNTGR